MEKWQKKIWGLEEIRENLSEKQKAVLNLIWQYFCDNGYKKWPPAAFLYNKIEKQITEEVCNQLGSGLIIVNNLDGQRKSYELSIIGILVTFQGKDLEIGLLDYLEYVRLRLQQEPDLKEITSSECAANLGLAAEQLYILRMVLSISPFMNGGFISGKEWTAGLPTDIDEICSDDDGLLQYFRTKLPQLTQLATGVINMGDEQSSSDYQEIKKYSELSDKQTQVVS